MQVATDSQIKDFELRNAIKNENLDYLKNFIDEGGSVNGTFSNGLPLLSCAAFENSLNVASFLLDRGADINIKWSQDWTPLYFTVHHNQTDAVKLLLSRGAFVDARSQYGETPLYFTIQNKNLGIAKLLIDNGADVNVKWGRGKYITTTTPLYFAVTKNQSDLARLFLDSGADINASVGNSTPLLQAVAKRKLEMKKLLLDRGADVNNQARLLHHVLYNFHTGSQEEKLIKLEIEKSVNHTPLHYAAREGKLDLISRFLNKGDDINAKDKNGLTPLHYTAQGDKLDAARLLVEKGANIGAKTNDERTPFELAPKGSQVKSFLSVKQNEYDSLLLSAAHNGDISKVADLLNKGANIEAKGVYGWRPLHFAAWEGHLETARFLVYRGANINAVDTNGRKPIHAAAQGGHNNVIGFLLSMGVNVNDFDADNWTALHYAAWQGHLEAVRFLVDMGANINARSNYNETPLDVANRYGETGVASFLRRKQSEKHLKRKRPHHHGDRHRHHHSSSRRLLAADLSNQPEVVVNGARQDASKDLLQNDEIDYTKRGATSGASKPSSWIDGVKGVFQFISSPFKPDIGIESSQPSKARITQSIDTNGALLLLDVFIRKITGQKYISTVDQSMPLQGYALNIMTEFERVLKDTAKRSGVSVNESSFNYFKTYQAIEGKMISGELSKMPTILYSAIEEAYPKNGKFLSILKGNIEKMLNEQQLVNNRHSSSQVQNVVSVSGKVPLSSLSSIAVEPANNKSLEGVTYAGRVA